MSSGPAQLAQHLAENPATSIALWADSSYGPWEENDVMKVAKDLQFPLSSFTCSFGGGLTVKGDFHDPAGQPAEVVFIEMGYNDESTMSREHAINQMRQRQWYRVLKASAYQVKFVIFVHQPSYKQTCAPRKKKKKAMQAWTEGALVEGSKWTDDAMKLAEELGIVTIFLKAGVEELFTGMLVSDAEGNVWQAKGRSYTQSGVDYTEDGALALWEDPWHPTAAGAEQHFRCLVKAFRARYMNAGVIAQPAAPPPVASSSPPTQAWTIPALQQAQQVWVNPSMHAQFTNQSSSAPTWPSQMNNRERSRSPARQNAASNGAYHGW